MDFFFTSRGPPPPFAPPRYPVLIPPLWTVTFFFGAGPSLRLSPSSFRSFLLAFEAAPIDRELTVLIVCFGMVFLVNYPSSQTPLYFFCSSFSRVKFPISNSVGTPFKPLFVSPKFYFFPSDPSVLAFFELNQSVIPPPPDPNLRAVFQPPLFFFSPNSPSLVRSLWHFTNLE